MSANFMLTINLFWESVELPGEHHEHEHIAGMFEETGR